jgi:hypothetical protein
MNKAAADIAAALRLCYAAYCLEVGGRDEQFSSLANSAACAWVSSSIARVVGALDCGLAFRGCRMYEHDETWTMRLEFALSNSKW